MNDRDANSERHYVRRWFVTVIGVLGATVLVVIGFVGRDASVKTSSSATTTSPHPLSTAAQFGKLLGKSLPGLPAYNWPVLRAVSNPPEMSGARAEVYSSSKDHKFEVIIFDFSNAVAEAKFYETSNHVFDDVGAGTQVITIPGKTGISGRSKGFELRGCGANSFIESGNECSGSATKPHFVGALTVFQRASTVVVITDTGLLVHNAKVASSVSRLLTSCGFR